MITERHDLFVDRGFQQAHTTDSILLVNPAYESQLARVPDCDAADVQVAVDSSCRALKGWRLTPPEERAEMLAALALGYERRADEFADLIRQQNGSPAWWMENSVKRTPVNSYRNASELARKLVVEEYRVAGGRSIIQREPVGVVGAIVPWNAPQSLLSFKLGPALAAGCTVIVKPSPETTLDAYLLAEVIDGAGLPPGVVNIVPGGKGTGASLVANKGVDKISFTGSTAAGSAIAAQCGGQLKPMSAELGGKSAVIVCDDADLKRFESFIVPQCLPYSGQVCYSCTRVLVHRSRFDEVLELLTCTLQNAQLGSPDDPETIFGPLVTDLQLRRVTSYVESGIEQGARLVIGGGQPRSESKGFYFEPSIFVDVTPDMRVFQEEIFGPVLCVCSFDDDEEAIDVANSTDYGLSGAVFSEDAERATSMGRVLDTGRVLVNGQIGATGVPLSGRRTSGVGLEGTLDPLDNYLQVKSITQSD